MFKFLKDKLKSAVSAFTKKVDAEAKPAPKEPSATAKPKKAKPAPKVQKSKKHSREPVAVPAEELVPELETPREERIASEEMIAAEPATEAEPPVQEPEQIAEEPELPAQESEPREAPEPSAEPVPVTKPEPEKKSFWGIFKKREVPTTVQPAPVAHEKAKPSEPKGFFGKITEAVTKTAISESKFEELFTDLEIALLESNVAFAVVEKIKADLKRELVDQKVLRGSVEETIARTLRQSIDELFLPPTDVLAAIRAAQKPFIIAFVGVNGSGKTTTIAKFAHVLQEHKLRPVIAAADTFRAAAIQQLEEHANKLGVKLIKQDYGADPAAVGYDAINYAKAHAMDVVLIDTAGRQHANTNLMEEMKKIIRVCKPNMTIFIGESITGNYCVEQAREFGEAVHVDGIILTKADVDEKGGAFVSVSYITGKPILYVGMGQGYGDLKPFDKKLVLENLGIT